MRVAKESSLRRQTYVTTISAYSTFLPLFIPHYLAGGQQPPSSAHALQCGHQPALPKHDLSSAHLPCPPKRKRCGER
jgi:hypothetical protein